MLTNGRINVQPHNTLCYIVKEEREERGDDGEVYGGEGKVVEYNTQAQYPSIIGNIFGRVGKYNFPRLGQSL